MFLSDVLRENRMAVNERFAAILALAIKDLYPLFYDSCKVQGWDDYKIVLHLSKIELKEEEINSLLGLAARVSKVWAFS